ncbi:hypothetical protein KKG57_00015, partial [Patescibacteria group bacterium]|nr:hypothetical protein [Patescibacteria group bacterium]
MIRVALLTLFFLGFGVVPALAQEFPGADPLSAVISPQYPRPFQLISISPRSSLINLSASTVEVLVDGVVVYTGSGTRAVTAQVGDLGSRTNVVVRVTDPSGFTYSKQYSVRPAEVSLILEPRSTTHPFYTGGSLVASEAPVRLLAVADLRTDAGTKIPANSLVYTWRVGNRILTDASGTGRSSLVANAPVRYRNADITVTVTSADNSLVGEAKTTISAVDPITRIYRSDPLLGPNYDVALTGKYTMIDT